MGSSPIIFFTLCCILSSSIPPTCSAATHSLTPNQSLTDGQTLVSSNQRFELGFFSPGSRNSSNRYLGIWYKNIPLTIVWVANRNRPLSGPSGSLTMAFNGSLSLSNDKAQPAAVWSVSFTVRPSSPVLRLLGNGNLVLLDGDGGGSGDYMWQSFDYMTDNLLPEMKLGFNLNTGLIRNVTSWAADDDPSPGEYTFSLHPPEAPQLILTKGTQKLYRWGPWDGSRFSGSPSLKPNTVFTPRFNTSREEIYYSFLVTDQSVLLRFVVTGQGMIQYLTWSGSSNSWVTMVALERDDCKYGTCGLYGVCYTEDPHCNCLKGFTPESPESWNVFDWTGGCTRKWRLDCEGGDGFVKYKDLKLPDNAHLVTNMNLSLSFVECQERCLMNCSCMAFTRIDVHGNGGDCLMWYDDLIDLRDFPDEGDEIYIRMARAEIESIADAKRKKRRKAIITIVTPIVVGMLLFGVMGWYVFWKRRPNRKAKSMNNPRENGEEETEDLELPLLSLATVSAATSNFASENKIGEGGFGPVYKGVLTNGQEIAVKRLSQTSGQGIKEFKNEVILIAKLQHRNLVKLLGCCTEREEKMLVYEYLPNKSLDCFLFDQTRKSSLTWKKHFDIIMGIARGLLYLHQDSRLRIIHRDLKASNVLLDIEMNPKISDFGIARTFGGEEQTEERTKRVIGTYGYMSPEYAMNGHFSTKSDVYSFGVIVLEIVSAQKNWGFDHPDHDLNLLGHAWKLWNEGKPLELMDPSIEKSFDPNEVMRCIQVALLCVQQRAEDRPTMSSVVFMLGNESAAVAQPKEPGFVEASFMGMDTVSTGKNPFSSNELTFTTQDGR